MNENTLFAAMIVFGILATEGLVEYLVGQLADQIGALAPYKWAMIYVSAAVGVALAFVYGLDFPAVALQLPESPVGVFVTGLVVGRGGNFVSELWQRLLGNPLQRLGIQEGNLSEMTGQIDTAIPASMARATNSAWYVDLPEEDLDDGVPF